MPRKPNRNDVLNAVRALGGDISTIKSPADARAFLKTKSVDEVEVNIDNAVVAVDVDAAWKTVYVTADAGEAVEIVAPPNPEGAAMGEMGEEEEEPKTTRSAQPKRANAREMLAGQNAAIKTYTRFDVPDFAAQAHKKAYTRAAQQGGTFKGRKPLFSDADEAEYFGAAMRLSAAGHKRYSQKANDLAIVGTKATGTTLDNEWGGVLVVEETAPQIIDLLHKYGVARQLAGVTPMRDGEQRVKRKTADMTFAYEGETDEIAETEPAFDEVRLIATKLAGIAVVSNELLSDSAFNIADIVAESSAAGLAKQEDQTYLLGTGLANFTGVSGAMDSNSTYDAALSSGWSDATIAKIEGWLAMIPVEAWRSGTVKIVCSQRFWRSVLYQFAPAAGGNTGDMILGGFGLDTRYTGIPVVISEVLPSSYSADQLAAFAGSFERGTKLGIVTGSEAIDASEEAYWKNDKFAWRVKERIAYNTHDCGGTASEVIAWKD